MATFINRHQGILGDLSNDVYSQKQDTELWKAWKYDTVSDVTTLPEVKQLQYVLTKEAIVSANQRIFTYRTNIVRMECEYLGVPVDEEITKIINVDIDVAVKEYSDTIIFKYLPDLNEMIFCKAMINRLLGHDADSVDIEDYKDRINEIRQEIIGHQSKSTGTEPTDEKKAEISRLIDQTIKRFLLSDMFITKTMRITNYQKIWRIPTM